MKHLARALILLGALSAAAHAGAPVVLTDEDWTAAATAALAVMERNGHLIVVLDDRLPPAARTILSQLRETVARDALPEQEKYSLPPGGYLLVTKLEPDGNRFEFTATRGVIPRGSMRNCGVTEDFFVAQDTDGVWKVAGPTTEMVC